MKVYILTDMEGCAGIMNFRDWCQPDGCHYEKGKELLTMEVNAAIQGMYDAGVNEVHVLDGHGSGGIIPELLDTRAFLINPEGLAYPFGMDRKFDALAVIGQHAKSGTDYSHISHTGNFAVIDKSINGVSIGEYGVFALIAHELGIKVIFASGEEAFCREAEYLSNGIQTVPVKKGILKEDANSEAMEEMEYANSKLLAVHLSPETARKEIRKILTLAVKKLIENPEQFHLKPEMTPPYCLIVKYRKSKRMNIEKPAVLTCKHNRSIIGLMNRQMRKIQT